MSKPLFRWTCGPCLQQGLDILAESIVRTTRSLGIDNFDWMICTNSLTKENIEFLKRAIGDRPINLFTQNWTDCPINEEFRTPRRPDGSFEWNGNKCGGTLWKVCPARMRMESHEIVIDNDILLLKKFPEIDEFLAATDKALILEEPIRFYGRFDSYMGEAPFLNSGFMGFPPGYDFGKAIEESWIEAGSLSNITQADEQGLLMYTLNKTPSIRVKADQMIELLARDFNKKITGQESGLHFTQANRIPSHWSWNKYKGLAQKSVVM